MIRKVIVSIGIITLFQSCIKQDKIEVSGNVQLVEESISIKIGEKHPLEVKYIENGTVYKRFDANNEVIPYVWSVSDPNVISVNSEGLITGVKAGSATISVSAFGSPAKIKIVNVVADGNGVANIALSKEKEFLLVGKSLTITPSFFNLDGEEKSDVAVDNWTTTNEDVLSISQDGVLTAKQVGEARIQASVGEIKSFPTTFYVLSDTIRRSTLYKIDYETSGTADIILTSDNKLTLRFNEDFSAPLAPGLPGVVAYLSNSLDANEAISNGLRVGGINQGSGVLEFEVNTEGVGSPVDVFKRYKHVLLICEPFKISFGAGNLSSL